MTDETDETDAWEHYDEIPVCEEQREVMEWAERNGHEIFEKERGADGRNQLYVKIGSYKGLYVDAFGGVEAVQRKHLCNDAGEVRPGEKQLTVVTETGDESHITREKFPI